MWIENTDDQLWCDSGKTTRIYAFLIFLESKISMNPFLLFSLLLLNFCVYRPLSQACLDHNLKLFLSILNNK